MRGVQPAVQLRPLHSGPLALVHGAWESAARALIRQATNLTASRSKIPAQQPAQLQIAPARPVRRCQGQIGHRLACGIMQCGPWAAMLVDI